MSPLVNLPLQIYLHIALKVIHDKKKKKKTDIKIEGHFIVNSKYQNKKAFNSIHKMIKDCTGKALPCSCQQFSGISSATNLYFFCHTERFENSDLHFKISDCRNKTK